MAKTFNLAEHISSIANVSVSGTPRIELLPVRKIFPNENNFYDTTNINELVNSILMYGVLDPITVKPSGDGEGYVIISGHRRHRAVTKILDEGLAEDGTKFRTIPCIVRDLKDELLEELMLIQANSATRVLTSAEVAKQVSRVEALLYELKEQGYEFPGRMRDNVAAACQVSASKIARLKVIQSKLIPEYMKHFEKDTLSESVAYALARLHSELQKELFEYRKAAYKNDEKKAVSYLTEWKVKDFGKDVAAIGKLQCSSCGGACANRDGKLKKLYAVDYSYKRCAKICCTDCDELGLCKQACPRLATKVQTLKAEAKEERTARKAVENAIEQRKTEQCKRLWMRFGEARRRSGVGAEAAYKAASKYFSPAVWSEELENGEGKYHSSMSLPLPIDRIDVSELVSLADALQCSLDYLLCRSDEPTATPKWSGGKPPLSGWYVGRFSCDGYKMQKLVWYDTALQKFYFDKSCGRSIEAECVAWYPVPQEDEQ